MLAYIPSKNLGESHTQAASLYNYWYLATNTLLPFAPPECALALFVRNSQLNRAGQRGEVEVRFPGRRPLCAGLFAHAKQQ